MQSDIIWPSASQTRPLHSLEVTATASLDTQALAAAMARAIQPEQEERPGSVGIIGVGASGSDIWLDYKWHVWWALSGFWRDDFTLHGETFVNIAKPGAALTYVSTQQILYTSIGSAIADSRPPDSVAEGFRLPSIEERLVEFPLIRSRLPASEWQIESLNEETFLGRPAKRVRATRRAGSVRSADSRLSGFWFGVDEYECVIDAELEIVMSVTGIVDAISVATIAVEHISVDARLPATTFNFSPPVGTRTVWVRQKAKTRN